MKRRKPPFVLIGILAISLATIVFFSMNFTKMTSSPSQGEVPPPITPIGASRQGPSVADVKGAIKAQAPTESPDVVTKGMAPQSTVLNPKPTMMEKPKPSDSNTSSGWYTKEYGPGQKK